MTGNSLPNELDLISLAQTESNRIYVIVENGQGQQTGPVVVPTAPTTRRPSRPEMAAVTFTSGRSYLRLPQWSPGRRGTVSNYNAARYSRKWSIFFRKKCEIPALIIVITTLLATINISS